MENNPEYYDWDRTISYNADVTMVVGERGLGKTYGLRKQLINDYINNKFRFCALVRYKNELSSVTTGYFDKVKVEFPDYEFKTDNANAFIAKKPEGYDGTQKLKWEKFGYFKALTSEQLAKQSTCVNVKRVVLDEAVINRRDIYHRYLPVEPVVVAGIFDSVTRERAGVSTYKPNLYLLGNAVDFGNPYFAWYKVPANIKPGYRWFKNKTFLLHFCNNKSYALHKEKETVVGRMLAGTIYGEEVTHNKFILANNEYVEKKTSDAIFRYGFVFLNKTYGIWSDARVGKVFVTQWVPKNTSDMYYLTTEDMTMNYSAVQKSSPIVNYVRDAYYYGFLYYQNVTVKNEFIKILQKFGVQ